MSGKKVTDIPSLCEPDIIRTETVTYFLTPQGAESFPASLERAHRFLESIESVEHPILLVTHGDFGKMLYAAYYKLEWKEVLTSFHFGNSEMLILDNFIPKEKQHLNNIKQFNH